MACRFSPATWPCMSFSRPARSPTACISRWLWGNTRCALGHFLGRLIAIDPHRVRSFSKRHMRLHRHDKRERPTKTAQTFFALDVETGQPICFTTGTSARTAAAAAEELLKLAGDILNPEAGQTLVLADSEHFTTELLDRVKTETKFDILVPMPNRRILRAKLSALLLEAFPALGGLATLTAKVEYTPRGQPGRAVLRVRPAARGTAGGLLLQRISRLATATRLKSWREIFQTMARGGIL